MAIQLVTNCPKEHSLPTLPKPLNYFITSCALLAIAQVALAFAMPPLAIPLLISALIPITCAISYLSFLYSKPKPAQKPPLQTPSQAPSDPSHPKSSHHLALGPNTQVQTTQDEQLGVPESMLSGPAQPKQSPPIPKQISMLDSPTTLRPTGHGTALFDDEQTLRTMIPNLLEALSSPAR